MQTVAIKNADIKTTATHINVRVLFLPASGCKASWDTKFFTLNFTNATKTAHAFNVFPFNSFQLYNNKHLAAFHELKNQTIFKL